MLKPLLFSILPRAPHPTRDGLAIRNSHLLEALSLEFDLRVFLLEPGHLPADAGRMPPGIAAERFPLSRRTRQAAALAATLVSSRPYSERLYASRPLRERLAAAVAASRPAWVVAHSYHVGPAAVSSGAPAWVDFHNLDSEIWARVAANAGFAARAFARLQASRVAALERRLTREAAGFSAVSRRDAEALEALSGRRALLVPNGVDLLRYAPREDPGEAGTVFFVGDLTWPPNADAVAYFSREIWPRIRAGNPGARAEILGRGDRPGLVSGESITLLGEGGDTRPHWERAAVAVVPLRSGGGSRLKILEAAASGVPVVATTIGAEGIELVPEREILLADDPEAFADAVLRLLRDADLRRSVAAAARAKVEAQYGWERVGRDFARALAERAGQRA
ncbi:MAG TPA: glycosyltransferase [Thermoanaerobaculia bacterium]